MQDLYDDQKVHVFRPFSGYGSSQALDYPFPSFIKRIKDKVDHFEIWGDGTQTRDFIHINDIVKATMRAVELEIIKPINLGSGVATSFNQLFEKVVSVSGYNPRGGIKHLLDKPVGVHYRYSDPTLMNEFYKLSIDLETGIEMALNDLL
mgnify:CR=1 FL=1